MLDDLYADVRDRMEKTIDATKREFNRVRTGRATPELLDGINVEVYGADMKINQLATIAVPQPRTLTVTPFDKNNLSAIERAISTSELNITPRNDGSRIFLEIPALTEERRQELAKRIRKKGEEMKIAIRNVRRDGNDECKMYEQEKEISEDDCKRGLDKIQEITDEYTKKIDELIDAKEQEIMEF